MNTPRLETVLGIIEATLQMDNVNAAYQMGVNDADLELATGGTRWKPHERERIKRTISSLTSGSVILLGLGEFKLPAEYQAANIFGWVHPANWMTACHWMSKTYAAQDLANYSGRETPESGADPVTPQQLFGLLVEIASTKQSNQLLKRFREKLSIRAFPEDESNEKKKQNNEKT